MSAHTPGPWEHAELTHMRFGLRKAGSLGAFFMLQCVHDNTSCPQAQADARLIAAAPGLLDACKAALAALSQPMTHSADIAAAKKWLADASAKAEGRT